MRTYLYILRSRLRVFSSSSSDDDDDDDDDVDNIFLTRSVQRSSENYQQSAQVYECLETKNIVLFHTYLIICVFKVEISIDCPRLVRPL